MLCHVFCALGVAISGCCVCLASARALAESPGVESAATDDNADPSQAESPAASESKPASDDSKPTAEESADAAAKKPKADVASQEAASKAADAGETTSAASQNGPAAKSETKAAADKPIKSAPAEKQKPIAETPSAPKRAKVRLAQFIVKDTLPETSGQSGLFGNLQLDLRETIARIDKAAEDTSIAGAVLDIRNPQIGQGKIHELRAAIERFRAKGKKMYAQLESATPADYLVACACDEIVMPESGMIVLPGIHAEATFYKGLLGKLGIQADFIHIGDYKAAAEPLTREKFSKPVRQNMTELVDGLYDEMVTTIVKNRPLSVAQVEAVIDRGLLTATAAKELGLIDRIAYSDVLREELADSYSAEPLVYVKNYGQKKVDTDFSGPMGFIKLMQLMTGGSSSASRNSGKKIAVVYALGPITTGKSQSDPFGGEIMGSTTIVEALREANDDKQVAAIVLRIDSPGGSALASDLIWRETQVITKPIVASMGDVAGSGGYYIAMGADKIVASPGTITGSIGVVGGKLAIRGLYKKIGISTETIERGRNSGLFASSSRLTESQREVVTALMQDVYDQFTSKAAAGRHMPLDKLQELAGGRVYTGRQALANGLVDQIGTLYDAIQEAKQLAGIDRSTKVRVELLPEPTNFFETLFGGKDSEEEVRLGAALAPLAPELVEVARKAYQLRAVFDGPAALVMPFVLEIR
jgi:protease-4